MYWTRETWGTLVCCDYGGLITIVFLAAIINERVPNDRHA